MIAGRDIGDPNRRRLRLPPIPNHFSDGLYQLITKAVSVLVIGNQSSPSSIAPAGQDASRFRAQILREIATKAEFDERAGRHLLLAFERQLRLPEISARLDCPWPREP